MISFQGVSKSFPRYLRYSQERSDKLLRRAYSKKSASSSSSSSSDSDSDKTTEKQDEQVDKAPKEDLGKAFDKSNTNARLNSLLEKISKAHQESKVNGPKPLALNIAIKPKKERFKKAPKATQPKKSLEENLKGAAKNVAESLGGDTQKTELELLSKALNLGEPKGDPETSVQEGIPAVPGNLDDLLTKMRVEEPTPDIRDIMIDKSRQRMGRELDARLQKPGQREPGEHLQRPSIASTILASKANVNRRNIGGQKYSAPSEHILENLKTRLSVFPMISDDEKSTPQLSIWETLQHKEMKLAILTTPNNVFEELIQWTEEGKIWHFPINNEQGMEAEENVHFSEHVFLEKHLKDWCPKRGPIRHFMELVCTGLSKNPYMTVEEKIGHITWYRDYFEDKKDLLNELNLLDDKAITKPAPSKTEKIEA